MLPISLFFFDSTSSFARLASKRNLVLALALFAVPCAAHATMPALTERPSRPTAKACQAWAAAQDEDAVEMWGALQAGGASSDVGKMRLTLTCLGDEKPEIVGFGSSAGYDDSYCAKHPQHGICQKKAERSDGAPACFVADPTRTPMNYRTAPNGKVIGSIVNGQAVSIIDTKVDANGKRWAFISDGGSGTTLGWAFQAYLSCGQ